MSGRPWNELDLKPHGTTAAYRRHYRLGEKPCESCRQAMALYQAESRSRAAYDAERRDRYRAARDAGIDSRRAMVARSTPAALERVLAGAS